MVAANQRGTPADDLLEEASDDTGSGRGSREDAQNLRGGFEHLSKIEKLKRELEQNRNDVKYQFDCILLGGGTDDGN